MGRRCASLLARWATNDAHGFEVPAYTKHRVERQEGARLALQTSYPQAELDQPLNTFSLWISRLQSKWSALPALDLMNYFSRNLEHVRVIGGPKVQQ